MSAVLHQQITGGTKSHTPGRAGEAQHYAANPGRDTKPPLCKGRGQAPMFVRRSRPVSDECSCPPTKCLRQRLIQRLKPT